ncbi:MAG: ATP-binding cassette domain-containing protein [Clostridia bacterium]|nr:ATP-binding cassette domain-containing protein [Clostridia bacterium]
MILISNLYLKYVREYYALYDINLKIKQGESIAFIGEKESGKTTLLRVLAKLEKFGKGEVYIKDIPLKKINYATDIKVGYLPATPVFFENKSVYKNFKKILKLQKVRKAEIENKINDILIEFNLENLKEAKIKDLSLYEKYLVSIARLCFRDLDIVLVDELLDNVSEEEKEHLVELLQKKFLNKKTTFIFATQDQALAKKLCKRRVYFEFGSIVEEKSRK